MNNVLKQLQSMYEAELYSSVVQVCDLILTAGEQKPETLPPPNKFQVTVCYADSMLQLKQYLVAENLYRQALLLRKPLIKNKNTSHKETQSDLDNEADLKFRIHQCCMAQKQKNAAIEILEQVTARLRTPKINMALANLYKDGGMERQAIMCYKEVLRECPLAVDAVESLLKLGVNGTEVNSLMVGVTPDVSWLGMWLKAQAQLHSRDYSNAIQTYKTMNTNGILKDNIILLVNMGYCYHFMGEDDKAIDVLQRAFRLDRNLIYGRDLLANLLSVNPTNENILALEALCLTTDTALWSSEHWVAVGALMYATKKFEKATYFSQEAINLNRSNLEAMLLKARVLSEVNKYADSNLHSREGIRLCPHRFDFHQVLVNCYIKINRLREADALAVNACKQLNYSPQSLTLHASVLLKDPMTSNKIVKKILEKAVAHDKTLSTNAVCMLVEFLEQEQLHDQARQLLMKYIDQYPTSRLHQLLGDCFVNLQKDDDAFHHYNIALRLDPTNQRATEGLNNIGRNLSLSKRESYYTCVGESSYTSQATSASDHEVYPESDTDPWPANNSFE